MFHLKYLFCFIVLHLIIAAPQINLYYTDWVSEEVSERDNGLQHDCLRVVNYPMDNENLREIISYCLDIFPSEFYVENNEFFSNFTFGELSKKKITSRQLYLWSAPIDVVERYQFYLNQLSTINNSSLAKQIFYNCTFPRFGPKCQYEFYNYYHDQSSLYMIIYSFYFTYKYNPTTFTCYSHLKCNRGPFPACLDWTEICDGKVDCLDGAVDEEHCWQLEINQCKDDEYRCENGQCIPKNFNYDGSNIPSCIDRTDLSKTVVFTRTSCQIWPMPSVECEDITCNSRLWRLACVDNRKMPLLRAMHLITNSSVSKDCWAAFLCIINFKDFGYSFCDDLCRQNACIHIVKDFCPEVLYFPTVPIVFGDIYFVYTKNDLLYLTIVPYTSFYICYNKSNYNDYFVNASKILLDNLTCVHYEWFLHQMSESYWTWTSISLLQLRYYDSISNLYETLKKYHLTFNYTSEICNRTNMYQCIGSSKCVSVYRIMDNMYDCPYMDDENFAIIRNTNLMEQIKQIHFECLRSDKYISQSLVQNGPCDCSDNGFEWCEDENPDAYYIQTNILFQHICDGILDLSPKIIKELNETDETECEQWECINIYTRCNGVWNCPNARDEIGCVSSSIANCDTKEYFCLLSLISNCSTNEHLCVSPHTNELMCLPMEKTKDGNVDCLGGSDEPTLCGNSHAELATNEYNFYCINQNSGSCITRTELCNGNSDCDHGDDEQFCTTNRTSIHDSICVVRPHGCSDAEYFLCYYLLPIISWKIAHFILDGITYVDEDQSKNIKNTMFSSSSIIPMSSQKEPNCNRGLDLRMWLNNKNGSTKTACFCPPSFYGDQCQYQSQRISLVIKFQALSDSYQTSFAVVISLTDDSEQKIVHSYEQITYLQVKHCKTKFIFYLLYSTRPKNPENHYAIHIDVYEKVSLTYRGSLLFPVTFPFLPVHRLTLIVKIPQSGDNAQTCLNDKCIHGKCIKYSNNSENLTFCQCDEGWSGKYCTIQHICICASDSLCIGVSANNRSICVCRINRFGLRCLLNDTICPLNDNSTCQNGGQCIPDDDYLIPREASVCICQNGYSGDHCEIADKKLNISFDKNIILSQSIFIHFIEVVSESEPIRASTFRTLPVQQDSVTIYWSRPFHLVFVELLNKNYYLTVVQTAYNQSTTIDRMIKPSDRCPNINELFNESFVQWHLIRRIKYYHLPCQNQSLNLSCFYDQDHLCLCYPFGQKRVADCFKFVHNITFDCEGTSVCENGAQCLQDDPKCPTRSMCICLPCFYGIKCQFSTSGFGLSLDAILGYHILPNVSFGQQPFIIKMSLALTIIFIVLGLINGILSMMTFKNEIPREVGCGLYLFGSSITTLLIMIMFGLKFLILLLTQMTTISNKSFLSFQCHSLDFILRVCLNMDQWLNACVASERAFTVMKGARFVKKKSKQAARIVIFILLIFIMGTFIYDPIYRYVDEEESNDDQNIKRIWCIVRYQPSLQIYNYIINTFHFFGPFLINLISAIILITRKSRQQVNLHKQQTYKEVLRAQFREHKNLLTAPIVLVILALPRLIITFISKCMKSTGDSWLFLVGYFISFIPSMLTFVVFVLPSEFYRKEFQKTVKQFRTFIQRRFNRNS